MKKKIVTLEREKRLLQRKLWVHRKRESKLKGQIKRQNQQLKKLIETIDDLKQRVEEDSRMLELQSNDLNELHIYFQELTLFQGRSGISVAAKGDEMSKPFWILRKHQRNLEMVTRPHIKSIIRASSEKCIVSKYIGKCASECSIPGHDCACAFYTALLVATQDSPHIIHTFLHLMLQEHFSEPCHHLFSRILSEVTE